MGEKFKVDSYARELFSEDLIRGSLFFNLSAVVKKIDPVIRKEAKLGDWQVISQGSGHKAQGVLRYVKYLKDSMTCIYGEKTILLVDKIQGEEEIPLNVEGIIQLTQDDYPDMLSHVSVRARNLKVLLAVLFNAQQGDQIKQ